MSVCVVIDVKIMMRLFFNSWSRTCAAGQPPGAGAAPLNVHWQARRSPPSLGPCRSPGTTGADAGREQGGSDQLFYCQSIDFQKSIYSSQVQ